MPLSSIVNVGPNPSGLIAALPIDAPYFRLRLTTHVLLGVGFGMAFLPLLTLAMADVPQADAGLGSAIVNLSLQLAGAVGIAAIATAASYRTHALAVAGMPLGEATVLGFRFAAGVALVGTLVGITVAATLLRPKPTSRRYP